MAEQAALRLRSLGKRLQHRRILWDGLLAHIILARVLRQTVTPSWMARRLQHVDAHWTIGDSSSRVYVVPGGSGSRVWGGDCESAGAGGADGSANAGGIRVRY